MNRSKNKVIRILMIIVFTMMSASGGYTDSFDLCDHQSVGSNKQYTQAASVDGVAEQMPCHQKSMADKSDCCEQGTCQCHHAIHFMFKPSSLALNVESLSETPVIAHAASLHDVYIPLLKKPPIA